MLSLLSSIMANWWLNTLAFLASLSLLLFAFVVANSDFCGTVFESQSGKKTKDNRPVMSFLLICPDDKIILFPFLNVQIML